MGEVIEMLDIDTFSTHSERSTAQSEKLQELGKTFTHAGVYIAQRIDAMDQGKNIAADLAVQFYDYGTRLTTGREPIREATLETIRENSLTSEQTENIDRWLAGEDFFAAKMRQVDKAGEIDPQKKEQLIEEQRRSTLSRYFRVAEKSFALRERTIAGELREGKSPPPWQSDAPVHEVFIENAEAQMRRAIETPKRELGSSLFRRGMELLRKEMPIKTLPDALKANVAHLKDGEAKLRDLLEIDIEKERLEKVRRTGNIQESALLEEAIAKKIQNAVSQYAQVITPGYKPSEIVTDEVINCVSSTMLGGTFLSEIGINYVVGAIPEHTFLLF
ncbi:MAG: hypothetical protein ACRD4B_10810, partial [Acidobacteriota bacterium]